MQTCKARAATSKAQWFARAPRARDQLRMADLGGTRGGGGRRRRLALGCQRAAAPAAAPAAACYKHKYNLLEGRVPW